MKLVSQFEANLLRLLKSFLKQTPAPKFRREEEVRTPPCLSRAAVELMKDYLSKGCVVLLARHGWRNERYLCNGQLCNGRLWERTPPAQLGLSFSRNTVEFLLWITAVCLGDKTTSWRPDAGTMRSGDRLLLFLAFDKLRQGPACEVLRRHEYFVHDGLCRLAFADDFGDTNVTPDWGPWTTGPLVSILEALQSFLCERWLQVEEGKGQIASWQQMRSLGQSQERSLRSFTDAVTHAGRWDLARFLLRAMLHLLRDRPTAQRWIAKLDVRDLRLADRLEVYKAGLAFLRHLATFQQWEMQARTVGYFEDGYAASQLWKADWETYQGDELCRHAQSVLREVEPLGYQS